jgi:O-antigen/teichoic acid export membrane protein
VRRAFTLSLFDQAILSGLSLVLSLVLITYSGPAEFGRFVLAQTILLVTTSLQAALILTPIVVFTPGRAEDVRAGIISTLATADLALLAAALALAGAIAAVVTGDAWQVAAILALVGGGLQREVARASLIARERMGRVLALDSIFAVSAVAAIAGLWQISSPATAAIGGLAVGNLAAILLCRTPLGRVPSRLVAALRDYRTYWKDTKWALLAAGVCEDQMRVHVFVLEGLRGTVALGTVHAGRVLTAPISLLAITWERIARPRLSAHLFAGEIGDAMRVLRLGLAFLLSVALAYLAALYLVWDIVEALVFKGRYESIGFIVAAWSMHAVMGTIGTCLSVTLQSARLFRELARIGVIGAIVTCALLSLLLLDVPDVTAVYCLLAGNTVMVVLMLAAVRRELLHEGGVSPDRAEATGAV